MKKRKQIRKVLVGNIEIGGNSQISVQTMTNTRTADIKSTLKQIWQAKECGADIVRVTINDAEASSAICEIVKQAGIPIVADIHFNHIFALEAIKSGVAKVRINPGNIGSEERIKVVLAAANEKNIPIRIGINSGSLEKDILEKYKNPCAEALVESAMRHIVIANKFNFDNLILSVKSSSVTTTIKAYQLLSEQTNYPLHLGVTESGSKFSGTIKSSVAFGTLLSEGIGDTIRVSLTSNIEDEVKAGIEILSALDLYKGEKIDLISCPTCGRTETDIISIINELEPKLQQYKKKIKIAIMGCVVNGPGEAKEADIAICCGKNEAILFINGKKEKHINSKNIVSEILHLVDNYSVNY